jgi:hypothetical protein
MGTANPITGVDDRLGTVLDSQEWLWKKLLQWIKTDSLIPIIGPDLLVVEIDGRRIDLYRYVAEQMAAAFGIPPGEVPERNPLSKIAIRIGRSNAEPFISELLENGKIPVPAALAELARITPIQLFVTTTFDPMMERALNDVRFQGQKVANAWRYSPDVEMGSQDLPDKVYGNTQKRPDVFSLFGNAHSPGRFVITEGDTLDFMATLLSKERVVPKNLLTRLKKSNLLFLGNRFDDWLARFFLRLVNDESLTPQGRREELFADDSALYDYELREFFHSYRGSQCQVFLSDSSPDPHNSAVKFVKALAAAWERTKAPDIIPIGALRKPREAAGSVFISYDRNAKRAAQNVAESLLAHGVIPWIDESLQSGEEWEKKIEDAIKNASVFMPLISSGVDKAVGVVFKEWKMAADVVEAGRRNPDRPFILPVIIDENAKVPQAFRSLHTEEHFNGNLSETFIARVGELQKLYLQR